MGHLGSEMGKKHWQFRFTPELVERLIGQRSRQPGWEG
jgi:hypothetical protein